MSVLRFAFAVITYLLFFATFLYLMAFTAGMFVPKTVDGPVTAGGPSLITAVLINLGLIALFGIQHSVMARPGFKAAITKTVHPAIERSVYVLMTVVVLYIMFRFWQPIPSIVWSVEAQWAVTLLWALFLIGWTITFISTWLLNHFELFGLQQVWLDMTGKQAADPKFRDPLFYKVSRHPLYLGMVIGLWSIPVMTVGHLVLAVGFTIYVFIGIHYEERDLTTFLGDQYSDYRKRVGMLIPGLGKAKG